MDIKSIEPYAVANEVNRAARVSDEHWHTITRTVIDQAIATHEPMIDLSRDEFIELDTNPHARFERIWDKGAALLEVDENRGGTVVGRGETPSQKIPLMVKVTFRQEVPVKPGQFMHTRVIEAEWIDSHGHRLGAEEFIRETETEINLRKGETISDEAAQRMLLVDQSITACQDFRAQDNGISQFEPVVFEERNYTAEDYGYRAVNILDGRCEDCPLAKKLIELAFHVDPIALYESKRYEDLGMLLSEAMEEIELGPCNGQNCVAPDQTERIAWISKYSRHFNQIEANRFKTIVSGRGLPTHPMADEVPLK